MVKTKGPLLSQDAVGSVADVLTFTSNHRRQTLRAKTKPKNPSTAAQTGVRSMTKFLSQIWSGLSTADKDTWTNAYPHMRLSEYHAFLKFNSRRWANELAPTPAFPPFHSTPAASTNFISLTPLFHGWEGLFFHFAAPSPWGIVIHMSTTFAFIPTRDTVIAVIETDGAVTTTWRKLDLPPVWHFVRQQQFVRGGTFRLVGPAHAVLPTG